MEDTNRGIVSEQILVATGKSSRLDALRKKSGQPVNPLGATKKQNQHPFVDDLDQQTKEALHQAKRVFEETMNSIMDAYPAGKKNAFFKIKYGADAGKVKDMLVKDIFKLFELDAKKIKNFQMVDNLRLNGKP